jgi:hypothetical protein
VGGKREVGTQLGSNVGPDVRAKVGLVVGKELIEGRVLGERVGGVEGKRLVDGIELGVNVGRALGAELGVKVGSADGTNVGSVLGRELIVGKIVESKETSAVG